MTSLIRSYLAYARGETRLSLWAVLSPLSWLAWTVIAIRNFFFDHGIRASYESPLPVISVGNITSGGTNKTPFVEMISRGLLEKGLEVGIVSRGYGGNTDCPVVFRGGRANRDKVGDEPLLLSNRLPETPVAVSRDRLRDVDALKTEGVQVIVADDAFQHRRLSRDVDVVLVDASCPFGNGLVVPGGVLREPLSSLRRAHIVVITKSGQVTSCRLTSLEARLSRIIPSSRLFRSRLRIDRWCGWDGSSFFDVQTVPEKVIAFSAIGSPESFRTTLRSEEISIEDEIHFKDHHRYSVSDMEEIEKAFRSSGADYVVCTEKDIYNLPDDYNLPFPLIVPMLVTEVDDVDRFWKCVTKFLRPSIVVSSNGYGEDAMGALLAEKVRDRFPEAMVSGFPLVGRGEEYSLRKIRVGSSSSVTPTGGVVKYHFSDLVADIRCGLLGHIKEQIGAWNKYRGRGRTPLCVGDVYLFLHTLWGQGQAPLLIATAKTSYIHGHWKAESFLLKNRAVAVWTRDRETARELKKSGVRSIFRGNPIMDLVGDNIRDALDWGEEKCPHLLILPGSRSRAYRDVRLLLDSVTLVEKKMHCIYVAVVAPTLNLERLVDGCPGWKLEDNCLISGQIKVILYMGAVAGAAVGADVLLGLGGTANQVCAGLGVPVVSIIEKGKLVQQKLLGQAEWLVEASPQALSDATIEVLSNRSKAVKMAKAGRSRLGKAGALDDVVAFCSEKLGWSLRCYVYRVLRNGVENNGHKGW